MSSKSTRFGQIVLQRRTSLGLTQDDVASRGGPSDTLLSQIEAGLWSVGTPSTFKKLDRALGWSDGSARLAFHGGDPIELDGISSAPIEAGRTGGGASSFEAHVRQKLSELEDRLARLEGRAATETREDVGNYGSAATTQAEESSADDVQVGPDLRIAAHPVKGRDSRGRRARREMDEAGEGSQE